MDEERFRQVAAIMSRMAAGDRAAVFTLADEFGGDIAAALRRHLRSVGAGGVGRADLDGLVVDTCLELQRIAPAWDPAKGALPWVWARHRLHDQAVRFVGQYANRFDPEEVELGTGRSVIGSWVSNAPATEPEPADVLDHLAATDPLCRLLKDALAEVGSERDQAILLELALQQTLGDPAPARTVARLHGMRPAAVRQVWCRLRGRLRALAADDSRYALLTGLALLS